MRYTKVVFKLFYLFLLVFLVPLGIAGTIVYKHVHDITRDEVFRSFGEIYIVNRDKIKIAGTTKSGIFNQIVDTKEVHEVLDSIEESSGIYRNYKGIQVLGSALFVPEANWVIIAEKNVKEAFLPLTRIKYIFMFSGGGVFFLVLFFGFVISGKINDEIGEVVESFNSMTIKLKELLNEKELLMREIFHRVKNNMQVISRLLSLQCKYIKDEKYIEMVKESQDRIKAMALIHENLYRSKEFIKY